MTVCDAWKLNSNTDNMRRVEILQYFDTVSMVLSIFNRAEQSGIFIKYKLYNRYTFFFKAVLFSLICQRKHKSHNEL